MNQPVAFLNGKFCPGSDLTLSVDDLGFVQGAAVSERLRTFRGRLFRLASHLERLHNSLEIIDVDPGYSPQQIGQFAEELVECNVPLLEEGDDLGLSLFVTPGRPGREQPTFGMHCYPLPFGQWAAYYTVGQALTETGVRQVPANCWPLALKCRSRMHYYLADHLADLSDAGSRAILLDQDGFVSEASTANIVLYCQDVGLISPPLDRILPGVSLSVLEELANAMGIPMHYRSFGLNELESADEILLCSTSPCVWPVTRLNQAPVGRGCQGPVFQQLLAAWSNLVDLDIATQASQFAHRH